MSEDMNIRRDRMRFVKNTLSSRLTLIVFNVLYFISVYKSDVGNYYYTMLIGGSIIYNLVFMLITFLCSEGVKNYKSAYSYVLIALGALQIVRIFIIPTQAHGAYVAGKRVMENAQFIRTVVYLSASAALLFAGAAVNLIRTAMLIGHIKSLEAGVRG